MSSRKKYGAIGLQISTGQIRSKMRFWSCNTSTWNFKCVCTNQIESNETLTLSRNPTRIHWIIFVWKSLRPPLCRPFVIFTVSQFMVRNDSVSDGFMNSGSKRGVCVCVHTAVIPYLYVYWDRSCVSCSFSIHLRPSGRQISLRTWNLDKQSSVHFSMTLITDRSNFLQFNEMAAQTLSNK